jgi:hypothetical protein
MVTLENSSNVIDEQNLTLYKQHPSTVLAVETVESIGSRRDRSLKTG